VCLGIIQKGPHVKPVKIPGSVGDEAVLDRKVGVFGRKHGVPHTVVRDGCIRVRLVDPGVDALLLVEREEQLGHLGRGIPGRAPVGHLFSQFYNLGDPRVGIRGQTLVLGAQAAVAGEVPRVIEAREPFLSRRERAGRFVSKTAPGKKRLVGSWERDLLYV
jgi:hypothetical protein